MRDYWLTQYLLATVGWGYLLATFKDSGEAGKTYNGEQRAKLEGNDQIAGGGDDILKSLSTSNFIRTLGAQS